MKELKPYLRRSLTTSCPFMNKRAENTKKSTSQQQFPIFSPELSKMKRSVELLSRVTRRIDFKTACSLDVKMFEWFSQQPTSTFLHPYFAMRKLKYSTQDRQKPFSEFQQVAAVETCDKFDSVTNRSWSIVQLYSTWFTFIEFVFKLVVACSFWVARVIKNTLRKPFEFKWPEVRFDRRKQISMTRLPYNKLLTNLASSSRTGDIGPRSFCTVLAALGPYCHDLGPIFPGTALALG